MQSINQLLLPALLVLPSLAIAGYHPYPPPSQSSSAPPPSITDGTDVTTCFQQGSKFVSPDVAQNLTDEFNRLVCQSNPNAPLVLNPFEGITINSDGGSIIFQNTLDQVAKPPNCGEVVEDFQKLITQCFSGNGSPGAVLIEMGGGGRTLYIIEAP